MYKDKSENIEIYFICYKKKDMDLVETYYDEILNIHYWYFNGFLAYKLWKNSFKDLKIGELSKQLIIVAASKYLIYTIENKLYKNKKEQNIIIKDLEIIQKALKKIMADEEILQNL